jgi:hypothetical protein
MPHCTGAFQGALKGKILLRADLPIELQAITAKQLEWCLPSRRSSLKGIDHKQSASVSVTIKEESADENSSYLLESFDDDTLSIGELEEAFCHFLDKLDNLVSYVAYRIYEFCSHKLTNYNTRIVVFKVSLCKHFFPQRVIFPLHYTATSCVISPFLSTNLFSPLNHMLRELAFKNSLSRTRFENLLSRTRF